MRAVSCEFKKTEETYPEYYKQLHFPSQFHL
jgi:hypothetical protein